MGKYNQDKPLKIYSQQKHAVRIMYNKDRLLHTRELFKECEALNVYQVNIWKILFSCIKLTQIPTIYLQCTYNFFLNKFIVYHHLNCEISKSNFLYRAPLVTASVVRGVYITTNLFDRWTCTNDDLQFVVILQRSHSVIFLKIAVLKNSEI